MPRLDQRLQVLIDETRLRRIRESADLAGVPVGQWVRELIDERLGTESQGEKIRAFIEFAETVERTPGDALEDLHAARGQRALRLEGD